MSPEIAPETQHPTVPDRPPEPEINSPAHPTRKTSRIFAIVAAIVTAIGLAYWFRPNMLALLNQLLPYSSAIAFMVIGLIGVFYKDKDKYAHPVAAWTVALCMVIFGFGRPGLPDRLVAGVIDRVSVLEGRL